MPLHTRKQYMGTVLRHASRQYVLHVFFILISGGVPSQQKTGLTGMSTARQLGAVRHLFSYFGLWACSLKGEIEVRIKKLDIFK